MLIQDSILAKFPYEFLYCPPTRLGKRPLFYTDIKRSDSPHGFLYVLPGEKFTLSKEEYHRLFLQEVGALYPHEFISPVGPTKEALAADEVKKESRKQKV